MPTPSLQIAAAAIQRGAFADAKAICAEVLAQKPDDGEALFLLGSALAQAGEVEEAVAVLERAQLAAPGNVVVLNALGGAYGAAGRSEDAIKTLRAALSIDPQFPWARQNLALALKSIGDFAAARRNFERALERYPDFPDALAGLADVLLIFGDIERARDLADKAVQHAPSHLAARVVQADCALRLRKPQDTLSLLENADANEPPVSALRAQVLWFRARAWEQMKDHERAFAAFAAANSTLSTLHGSRFASDRSVLAPETVASIMAFLRDADVSRWPRPASANERAPVFVLGFPRSGTTLLDQILSAHPQIVSLEERMSFADALEPLVLAPGALARWHTLTQQEVEAFRSAYWRRFTSALAGTQQRSLFVDKLPLNTVLLPLIHLLFPDAKIVFAVRDPRDVVTSCFTQKFEMNVAMYQFLSLETAARYYDAVMRLAETARARLPLNLQLVRYEDVVSDFDRTVADVLRFLELPWDDSVRDYATHARNRLIRTPSAEQVRKPLYASSVGRWRNYATHVAPLDPWLEPWVRQFGYN